MTNNETDTVIHRIPVTGVMDLLITTNGCIDIMGGIDIQFMLNVNATGGGHVNSSISMEAAKEIYMAKCVIEREHWSVENQWHECHRAAAVAAMASDPHSCPHAPSKPKTLAKSADRHLARHQCGDRVAASGVEAVTPWHRHHGFEHSPRDGVVGSSTGRRPSTRSWSVCITAGGERHCLGRSLLTRGTGQRPSTVQPLTKHS